MNETVAKFAWDFPLGMTGLCLALAAGVLLIVLSYFFTLRKLRPFWRGVFLLLRLTAFGALMFCLCNPRIETTRRMVEKRPCSIAVFVDESGSMRKLNYWKRSRLQDALDFLERNELRNRQGIRFRFHRFSDSVRETAQPPAETAAGGGEGTLLFRTIIDQIPRLEAGGFDGAIYLTDGIDTSGTDPEEAFAALAGTGVRHIFVPVTTEQSAPPSLFLRTDLIFTLISILIDFVATVAVLPVVEHIFGACSNIRLSAYADYNSELLMRMDLEAPGTCQHAKNVADLAAAAAEHIGANALLARVGGLYHDIGKLNSPEYFSENIQPGTPNPHDSLPPTISAVILSAHVKDGIAMAIDNNLPYPVQQIIRTHHGNSLMPFFYKKAVSLAEAHAKQTGTEPEPVDESSFRYASPRPNTLEAAIVSLADGIEAASRSLTHKTTVSIERLVTAIIDSKMQDGQLDEAPLSCRQLAELKRVFTSRLTTILHARIPYTDEEAKKSIAALPGEVKSAVAAAQTPAPHPELPIPSGTSGS